MKCANHKQYRRAKLFQGSLVTVFIGLDETSFKILKNLLCFNSPFFDASFNGGFKEASEGKLYMAEDSADVFGMLFQWIYTGNITVTEKTPAQQLDLYLAFLKLADKVDLLGPFTSVSEKIRNLLVYPEFKYGYKCPKGKGHATKFDCFLSASCGNLDASEARRKLAVQMLDPLYGSILRADHLKTTFELPNEYGVREILVNTCVPSYLQSFLWSTSVGVILELGDEFCYPFQFQNQ